MKGVLSLLLVVLALYYWLDSVVLSVGSPRYPELALGSTTYAIAVASRSILVVAMLVNVVLFSYRYMLPTGAVAGIEFCTWIAASVSQDMRASIA